MGYFMSSLTNLENALGQGLDPQTALNFLSDLQQQRQEKRDMRRSARQEALASSQEMMSGIRDLAVTEAQQGTTLPQLAALVSGKYGSQVSPENLYQMPGLSSLYLPTGQEGFVGNSGQSRVAPVLDPDIAEDIASELRSGTPVADIYAGIQQLYGPATFARLRDEIDKYLLDQVKQQNTFKSLSAIAGQG